VLEQLVTTITTVKMKRNYQLDKQDLHHQPKQIGHFRKKKYIDES